MKYKVNDKVKVIIKDSCSYPFGYIGTVTSIDTLTTPIEYTVDHGYCYSDFELEPVNSLFPLYITQDGREIYADNGKPQKLQVKLKPLTDTAVIPQYATCGAACFDLCADEDIIVAPGQTIAVSTGLSFELPVGYQMKVLPRSGISLRTSLRVIIGTVDADYRGEVKVILWNPLEPVIDYSVVYDEDGEVSYIDADEVYSDYHIDLNNTMSYFGRHLEKSYIIRKGDRIAQAEVIPITQVSFAIVDKLSETVRGTGGFGSSGTTMPTMLPEVSNGGSL